MKRMLVLGGTAGLFVIVMLVALVQGIPTFDPPTFEAEPPTPPQEAVTAPPQTQLPLPEAAPNETVQQIIGIVLLVLAAVASALLLWIVIRVLRQLWRDRPLRQRTGDEVETTGSGTAEPEEDAAVPVIRRGIAGARRRIDEHPAASDAIVAAWVGLEESAADLGLARGVSETPAEFTLRIISRAGTVTASAERLLRLYERVRFGGLVADEGDREAARRALDEIEEGWR